MDPVIPVLDGDVALDAARLVNALHELHPDTPRHPYHDFESLTPLHAAAALAARGAWWVTHAPRAKARAMLLLGTLDARHRDTTALPPPPFAVLLMRQGGVPMYVRVCAPHVAYSGTLLDGEITHRGVDCGAAGWDFTAHALLAHNGARVARAPFAVNRELLTQLVAGAHIGLTPLAAASVPPSLLPAPPRMLLCAAARLHYASDWLPERDGVWPPPLLLVRDSDAAAVVWTPPVAPLPLRVGADGAVASRCRRCVVISDGSEGVEGVWLCDVAPLWRARHLRVTLRTRTRDAPLSDDALAAATVPLDF